MPPVQPLECTATVAAKPNILTVVTTVYNNVESICIDNGLPSLPLVVSFKDGSSTYVEGKFVGFDSLGQFIFEKTTPIG